MKSLLDKAYKIEEEASAIIEEASQNGKKNLSEIRSREEQVMQEVREKAQSRGQDIIKEGKNAARDEVSHLEQESQKTIKMVQEAAEKNRQDALTMASKLFTEDYLN